MNKNLFQSLSLSLNSLVTSFDINTQHQASFLARVSKSFKSTFLLSNFDNFCHAFPKLLYLTHFSIF